MPQVNPGSLYRCDKITFKRAACGLRQEERGLKSVRNDARRPAYLGGNESDKPFSDMIDAGCNSWRNWADIQCGWGSASAIIDHWGDYGETLVQWAGPGHWHDMDMLLIGAGCLTAEEERTQMAIWARRSPILLFKLRLGLCGAHS